MASQTGSQVSHPPLVPEVAPPGAQSVARPAYPNERLWRQLFRDGNPKLHVYRRMAGWLPSPPRCNVCRVPFDGLGGRLLRLSGCEQSHRNSFYCNRCDRAIRRKPGATDVELSMVFADVRGSTTLAERAEHSGQRDDYVRQIRHFEAVIKSVIERTNGFIIDVVGDEVVGVYPPGLCGPGYAAFAFRAARTLTRLAADSARDGGTLLPFGVGVHTGEVFLGNRLSDDEHPAEEQLSKIRIIGDHVNLTARLASAARPGEALVSDDTIAALPHALLKYEHREIPIRGRDESVGAYVVTA